MDIRYAQVMDWYNRYNDIQYYLKSITPKQIQSKQWLVLELSKAIAENRRIPDKGTDVWLLGGWFGYPLIDLLIQSDVDRMVNKYYDLDIDPLSTSVCYQYSRIFQQEDRVVQSTNDVSVRIEEIVKKINKIIINCSSEHMPSIPDMVKDMSTIDPRNIFVIQSNDLFDEPDHCNCVRSEDELIEKNKMEHVYFKGALKFDNYTRFMVIGSYNG